MTSLDQYIAERRNSRRLAATTTYAIPDNDPAVLATEDRIHQASLAAHADGYTTEQLIAAENADRLND